MPERQIVAMGGYPDDALLGYVADLARGRRLLLVPTASREDPASTLNWYERAKGHAETTHLHFFPWPPPDLRRLTLEHDVILVAGGNTANALAIWRTHGFDQILRDAWEQGVLLTGWSAGMICWFEEAVTDSFGPELRRSSVSAFSQAARVRTMTAKSCGVRRTPGSYGRGFRRGSLPTTTSPCTTSEPTCARS